jgi:hypothetical protein
MNKGFAPEIIHQHADFQSAALLYYALARD